MYALLANGPIANRQISVDDPPPTVVNMQAPRPDDFDCQPAVFSELDSPRARVVTHPYRFIGRDQIPSSRAAGGFREFAIYSYAPDLAQR
jgi:hypothetical protein